MKRTQPVSDEGSIMGAKEKEYTVFHKKEKNGGGNFSIACSPLSALLPRYFHDCLSLSSLLLLLCFSCASHFLPSSLASRKGGFGIRPESLPGFNEPATSCGAVVSTHGRGLGSPMMKQKGKKNRAPSRKPTVDNCTNWRRRRRARECRAEETNHYAHTTQQENLHLD